MGLRRDVFLVPYVLLTGTFLVAYFRATGTSLSRILGRHWIRGLLGGGLAGLILLQAVTAQPASPRPQGNHLLFALGWLGLVYGATDALLLNVVPVLAVYGLRRASTDGSWLSRLGVAAAALAASLFVTAAYHLGYAEFQGPTLVQPLIGNTIVTLSYLLTGSPLAALVSHIIMHVAAALHGIDSTPQLPPHY